MPDVTLSEAALAKIDTDWQRWEYLRPFKGRRERVARLLHYQRLHGTDLSGNDTDYGPGLLLSFVDIAEAMEERLLELDGARYCRLFIGPRETFAAGKHFIGYDERFRVTVVSLT